MVQAASKSNEIGEKIAHQLGVGEPFDVFTETRLVREIERLPDFEDRYHCLGRLYGVQRSVDELKNYFEKTLALTNDPTVYLNYYVALIHNAQHSAAYDVLLSAAKQHWDKRILEESLCRSLFCLNLDDYLFSLEKFSKIAPEPDDYSYRVLQTMTEANTVQAFLDSGKVNQEQLESIGKLAWGLVEKHNFSNVDSIIHHGVERQYLSMDFRVFDSKATPDDVFNLNIELIDKLVELELDEANIVVQFIRSKPVLAPDEVELAMEGE